MTLKQLEEWIEAFPADIPEIKQVIFGNETEIINRQNSLIRYPCMWVETPTPRLIWDPPAIQFKFFVTFLMNVPNEGDPGQYRNARNTALSIAMLAFNKFEQGEEQMLFELERAVEEGDEIYPFSGDRDTGYRFQISLKVGRNTCL